jgi:hypothetical protein
MASAKDTYTWWVRGKVLIVIDSLRLTTPNRRRARSKCCILTGPPLPLGDIASHGKPQVDHSLSCPASPHRPQHVPFLGGVPRRYAIGHRLFIEYGEMQRDLIRICRQPPKAISLLRAMSRECLRANRKRQIQKPVSQVRILPGAHFLCV